MVHFAGHQAASRIFSSISTFGVTLFEDADRASIRTGCCRTLKSAAASPGPGPIRCGW